MDGSTVAGILWTCVPKLIINSRSHTYRKHLKYMWHYKADILHTHQLYIYFLVIYILCIYYIYPRDDFVNVCSFFIYLKKKKKTNITHTQKNDFSCNRPYSYSFFTRYFRGNLHKQQTHTVALHYNFFSAPPFL